MSSGGVSRYSGRVRRKSAKLMENELHCNSPNQSNNNNGIKISPKSSFHSNNNSLDSHEDINDNINDNEVNANTSDLDIGQPLNKKLKIKLSLNTSPVIASDTSKQSVIKAVKIENNSNNSDDCNSSAKKVTIPPLKIPKSKITGILSSNTSVVESIDDQRTVGQEIKEENSSVYKLNSEESKLNLNSNNKLKVQINSKNSNDSKPVIEAKNEEIESTKEERVKTEEVAELVTNNINNSITETPKMNRIVEPKKKERESAANRLFRQITSGVAPTPSRSRGNRKKKSIASEDISALDLNEDEDFEETSLVIATDSLTSIKPRNKRSRKMNAFNDVKEGKKSRKLKNSTAGGKPKRKFITAYMLWSKENRSKIQQSNPDMDFADVSRKLGEIWQSMHNNDKTKWFRKAQKMTGKGSSIISTGKPKTCLTSNDFKANTSFGASSSALGFDLLNSDDYSKYTSIDEPRPIGTSPIDVSAHLKLLGESLSLIGQRLKEHSGHIAVSGSLSVLLDSTLCAIGPLLCLTSLEPRLDGCSQDTHKNTLDNIAYIMPGI